MEKLSKTKIAASGLVAAAVLTACGGGGGSTPAATASLAGVVADGYLTGAKVCLDRNENTVCDAGEPFDTTIAGGKYIITGIASGDESKYPIVAEVPASATDSDFVGTTVGKAFVLTAPKGNTTVTPLSSLVHQELQATPALSAASAAANVKTALGITSDPLSDYIATPNGDAHIRAQMITQSLKNNADAIGGGTAAQKKELQGVLMTIAKQAVVATAPAIGASAPATVPVVGVEDFNTVRAVLASKLTTGTASQAVTVNFDVVNGVTPVRVCNDVTLAGLKLWDQTLLSATVPATALAAGSQTAQSVTGKMVDLRFFISNVLLWDAAGNAVPLVMTEDANQSKNVALMDFGTNTATLPACADSTSTLKSAITGFVVPGTYTAISYTLGVPVRSADLSTKLNHSATSPATAAAATVVQPAPIAPLDTVSQPGMAWSWQSGRKFTKIEFAPNTAARSSSNAAVAKLNIHLGSSGSCTGNPVTGSDTACTMPNRVGVKLSNFSTATDTVKLDLAALYAGSDLTYDGGGAAGCMSGTTDPECGPIFKALGLGFAAGGTFGQTLTGAAIQTVFKK
jgi:uncharacterized repeat protein (TIGR04052 family)